MQSFAMARIPEIIFGNGRAAELATHLTAHAGKNAPAILLADPALGTVGITSRIVEAFAAAGHAVAVYDRFAGEPKYTNIDDAAAMARAAGARAVIGLGGGTALDTAKLVAACAVSEKPAEAYQFCETDLPEDPLPLIALPTTAGTGSEVTRTSVFANSKREKVWAWGDALKPRLALLDPELTIGVPAAVTAATGLDAIVHAIEACTGRRSHLANDIYCHRAISLIAQNLEAAIHNPRDLDARGALLLGSCYAGIGIDNCGTALAHNISHAMADLAPVPHGRATGLAMLATIDWVMDGNPSAYAKVASAMGEDADEKASASAYERLVRASGIKISLAGDGLELNRPERLAERMAAPANQPMRANTVREVSDADLLMLAERVYALR